MRLEGKYDVNPIDRMNFAWASTGTMANLRERGNKSVLLDRRIDDRHDA